MGLLLSAGAGEGGKKCLEGVAVLVFCKVRSGLRLCRGWGRNSSKNRGETDAFRYQKGTFRFQDSSSKAGSGAGSRGSVRKWVCFAVECNRRAAETWRRGGMERTDALDGGVDDGKMTIGFVW
jgi:hypothetical protein